MSGWSFGSRIYGGAWSTPALGAIFDDQPRTRKWLEILAVLAEVQAEFGLIPTAEAHLVAAACRNVLLDDEFFNEFRTGYERTGHSTAGLIQAMQRRCPPEVGEWLYFGATVQDVTDSWMMQALEAAQQLLLADLDKAIEATGRLSREHRDTVMAGRTHGQQGLPITFGFKAAGWLAELRRHRDRFGEIAERLGIGQLCGGVGSLSALGPRGLELQARFCDRLGLRPPDISWTASRDVVVEWGFMLVLASGTADRIGQEVYSLQRDEIGEVSESATAAQIGSITMPHKRNPEISEHLGTLSRVVRANASMLAESLPHAHERDGRSWKVEWHAVPELTMAAGKALNLLARLLDGLEVHTERMLRNLNASGDKTCSEAVMLMLASRTGKQTAHETMHRLAALAERNGVSLRRAVGGDPTISAHLSPSEIDALFDRRTQTARCGDLVDRVLAQER